MHRELLHGPNGLPLGLLSLNKRFVEIQYLISAEFRFGLAGICPWYKWLAYGALAIGSTLISLFAGPSTALLLIPERRGDWPAGGASISLPGTEDEFWPSSLFGNATGGPHCAFPTPQKLILGAPEDDCIWAGASPIGERFKESRYTGVTELPSNDRVLSREWGAGFRAVGVGTEGPNPETWVSAVQLAVGLMLKNAGQVWFQALLSVPTSNKYEPLRWRSQGGTNGVAESWIPIVRTSCDSNPFLQNSSTVQRVSIFDPFWKCIFTIGQQLINILQYPFLPEYDARPGSKILIPANNPNSSRLSAHWLTTPTSANLTDNSTTTDIPSALLYVFAPQEGPNTTAALFTCSVDARWTKATYTGGPIDSFTGHYVQKAKVLHQRRYPSTFNGWQYSYLPVNDGSWRKVSIDTDWLDALTPSVDNTTSGYTSLAALLSDLDISNHTYDDATPTLEGIVATLVANGMSRTNFRSTGKAPEQLEDPLNILPDESSSQWERFMRGSYSFPRPEGPATKIKLSVTVEGYAYRADSKAYRLALAVLLLHAILAIGHIVYVVRTRVSCGAWRSMINYVVIAATSSVGIESSTDEKENSNDFDGHETSTKGFPEEFQNASSGISRFRTMKTEVRLRAKETTSQPESASQCNRNANADTEAIDGSNHQVKMLFGRADEQLLEKEGYSQIAVGKVYS